MNLFAWQAIIIGTFNRGNRWEVDDYPNNDNNDTHHQIFIRKDSIDLVIPTADHLVCLAPLPNVSCEDGVVCAPFDEGAGSTSTDLSGNGNEFTLVNTPWVDNRDERGTYLDMSADSNSDYAIIENLDFPADDFTVGLWVSSNFTATEETLFSYEVTGEANEFMVMHRTETGLRMYLNGSTIDTGYFIPDSDWYHIAFTRESSSGTMKVFVDGTRVYSNTIQAGSSLTAGGSLTLGQDQDNPGTGFNASQELEGYMDDFRLYDRELSEAEILAIADGSSETAERFKTTGTYTTTITADPNIGVWDKLLLSQDLPTGSDIEYSIYDSAGHNPAVWPNQRPGRLSRYFEHRLI